MRHLKKVFKLPYFFSIACRDLKFRDGQCIRPNSFYAVGGAFCKKLLGGGSCNLKRVVLAVNLNGEEHISTNGITYSADKDVSFTDPRKIRKTWVSPTVTGVSNEDAELYKTHAYGYLKDYEPVSQGDMCVTYKVSIGTDGEYELTIKTLETWSSEKGKRVNFKKWLPWQITQEKFLTFLKENTSLKAFNIRLNRVTIMKEVDIIPLAGGKTVGVDLHLSFRVSNGAKLLHLMGHPDSHIPKGGEVDLGFCLGTAKVEHRNFIVSAFHIVQFHVEGQNSEDSLDKPANKFVEICRERGSRNVKYKNVKIKKKSREK